MHFIPIFWPRISKTFITGSIQAHLRVLVHSERARSGGDARASGYCAVPSDTGHWASVPMVMSLSWANDMLKSVQWKINHTTIILLTHRVLIEVRIFLFLVWNFAILINIEISVWYTGCIVTRPRVETGLNRYVRFILFRFITGGRTSYESRG